MRGTCRPEVLRLLLANLNLDPNTKNHSGSTAIMLLVRRGDNMGDELEVLLECDKVDLDVKDKRGRSLEDLAG